MTENLEAELAKTQAVLIQQQSNLISAQQEAIDRLQARVKFLQEWKDACEETIQRERRNGARKS